MKYELLDTGVFDQDRYFDVFVEYAKASPEDMLIQITVYNRGPEPATPQPLPTLWFRNDWSWAEDVARPTLFQPDRDKTGGVVAVSHGDLGERFFYAQGASALLFTEFEGKISTKYPDIGRTVTGYLQARPKLMAFIQDPMKPGHRGRFLGSILNETNLRRVLRIMLDEKEFLSPFGIRALSRIHQDHPYAYQLAGQEYRVSYVPGKGDSGMRINQPGLISNRRGSRR